MLKGTVEDLLANRLDVDMKLTSTQNSISIEIETKEGVPTNYSYEITGPNDYSNKVNNITENTHTFDKLQSDTEYSIKATVNNKAGLIKELTKAIKTEQLKGPTIEMASDSDTYIAAIYLDPTNIERYCDSSNISSTAGVTEGCMKWYAYKETDDTYTMLLDHNITKFDDDNIIKWTTKDTNELGPEEALRVLKETTDSWIAIPERNDSYTPTLGDNISSSKYTINYTGYRSRLIEAEEVAKIISADLSSLTIEQVVSFQIDNIKYQWLIGSGDGIGFRYWTSSPVKTRKAIYIAGHLNEAAIDASSFSSSSSSKNIGIRPVITIPKSMINN